MYPKYVFTGHTLLRLVGGSSFNAGRVELQHKGLWGAICCDGFTSNSGDVICKELGFIGYDKQKFDFLLK